MPTAALPRLRVLPGTAAAAVCLLALAPEEARPASVDAVKAGFVYNFASFVEWPPDKAPGEPVTFCFEQGSLNPGVYSDWSSKRLGGKRVRTRAIRHPQRRVAQCHVLLLAADGPAPKPVVRAARRAGTLIVADGRAFAESGGHIALVRHGSKLRFVINLTELRRAGLDVSSRLLRLAQRVIKADNG